MIGGSDRDGHSAPDFAGKGKAQFIVGSTLGLVSAWRGCLADRTAEPYFDLVPGSFSSALLRFFTLMCCITTEQHSGASSSPTLAFSFPRYPYRLYSTCEPLKPFRS